MSSRERWTIYPLLFLALGIAMKDKVTKSVTADSVSCKMLTVTDRQGAPQLLLGTTPSGGLIRIHGQGGLRVLVGHAEQLAGLLLTDDHGNILQRFAVRVLPPRAPQPTRPEGGTEEPALPPADEQSDQPPDDDNRP